MPFARTFFPVALFTFVAGVLVTASAYAQVDASALKAAYIYNFAQFTTWPSGSLSDTTLFVCANTDSDLGTALSRLDGKTVRGRAWSVIPLSTKGQDRCNVIVLEGGGQTPRAVKDLVSPDRPVLVVSEFDTDDHGTVVRLFTDDEDHLRFDIANQQALRRHLILSSKLLRLARSVQ